MTEKIIYNTLQEVTTVRNPQPGKKSFTFLMIVERRYLPSRAGTAAMPAFGSNLVSMAAHERGGGGNEFFKENQSQFSNPFSENKSGITHGHVSDIGLGPDAVDMP